MCVYFIPIKIVTYSILNFERASFYLPLCSIRIEFSVVLLNLGKQVGPASSQVGLDHKDYLTKSAGSGGDAKSYRQA